MDELHLQIPVLVKDKLQSGNKWILQEEQSVLLKDYHISSNDSEPELDKLASITCSVS